MRAPLAQVDPRVMRAAKSLGCTQMRVTSIYRPSGRAGGHRGGRAFDVAYWLYSPGAYTLSDARALLARILRTSPGLDWLVVAEDDHFHVELMPTALSLGPGFSAFGQKSNHNGHKLEVIHVRSS